jgi:predicted esterase
VNARQEKKPSVDDTDRWLGPHQGQDVLTAGTPLAQARAAMILLHGRGSRAANILELAGEIALPGFACLAPQALGGSWYPHTFLAPLDANEPCLSSALVAVGDVLATITRAGIPPERVCLFGFSQGACLAVEFAARHAQRYGCVAALSGGLIGPDDTPRDYPGTLAGTPVFLGCSDVDPHVPATRVRHTAEVLRRQGAVVTLRFYPHMRHTVNADETAFVREMARTFVA